MSAEAIQPAIAAVPAGSWAVGVSGGADSVALLHLLHSRRDLRLVVAHLNHQTRGQDSDDDELFVRSLCDRLGVECRIARRADIEPTLIDPSPNPSALYRQLRLAHFRTIVESEQLQGAILAHHADDQTETVLQRLLRGAGFASLAGMSKRTTVAGIEVLRPLLDVTRESLRDYLQSISATWREDASNASPQYLRNRLRILLHDHGPVTESMLRLSCACAVLRAWVHANARQLGEEFQIGELLDQPEILARHSASQWLKAHGVPSEEIDRNISERLMGMCADAATPARQQFPGGITVRRRAGKVTSSHASQK